MLKVILKGLCLMLLIHSGFVHAWAIDNYGRDIKAHERLGGHTVKSHISKDFRWLEKRCKSNRWMKQTSSFYNKQVAEYYLYLAIKRKKNQIEGYAKRSHNKDVIYSSTRDIKWYQFSGRMVNCKLYRKYLRKSKSKLKKGYNVMLHRVGYVSKYLGVIRRKNTSGGWYLLTSYPY